jgi:hypothetical protein
LLAAGIACLAGGVLGVRVWGFAWVHGHHRREPGRVVLIGRSKTGLAVLGIGFVLAGGAVLAIRLGGALP